MHNFALPLLNGFSVMEKTTAVGKMLEKYGVIETRKQVSKETL